MDWTAVRRLDFLRILVSDAAVRAAETAAVGQRDDHEVTAAGERVKSITKNSGCQAKALGTLLTLSYLDKHAPRRMQLAQVHSEIELPCKHLLMIGAFSAERTRHLAGCADGFHGRHIAFSTFGAFVIAGVMLDFHADKADGKNNRSAECQ